MLGFIASGRRATDIEALGEGAQSRFRFAGFLLDLERGRLFRGDEDVALRPKSFALLGHLARNPGRVLSKDELLSALWPGLTVTEDSLTQCVHEIRRALGPVGPALLRTVPRRGYLFSPEAAAPAPSPASAAAQDATAEDAAPLLRRDGIAVLPIVLATSGDPAHAVLFDGLTHDVISRLARLRGFHVIARGSAFALRHLAADPQAAGKALRVGYVVSGTASIDGARVWLRVEIIDVAGGGIVWTGDFSESRAAFTELIAGLTDRVVHSVHMQVTAAESRRARAKPRETLDAWESYHAGVPDAFRSEPDRIERALERFRVAARLSPGFARAYAGQSACHYVRVFTGMTGDRAAEIALARRAAEEALDADETDPLSPWTYGRILWLEGDPEGCLSYVRRAVGLSPSFALGHYEIGAVEATKGDAARAVTHLDLAMELSPFDPVMPAALIARSMALFRLGRLDAAAQAARDAVRQPNTFATILAPAALILASVGHVEEARRIAARLETTPGHPGLEALRAALFRMSDHIGALLTKNGRLIGL